MRTCVGCRQQTVKAELVRLVVVDSRLHVDVRKRLPGRGAYLHRRRDCWDLAIGRRALSRALPNATIPHGAELDRLASMIEAPLR